MVSVFRQKSPGNLIVLFFFGLAVKLPLFLWPKQISATQNDGDFYDWMIHWLHASPTGTAMLCSAAAFALLYIQAVMVNYMVNEYRLMPKPSYLPAMAYMLLTSLLPEWSFLSSPLVATTAILWAFVKLFRLYNVVDARSTIFTLGLLPGVSSYFYFPSASFLLCILLGIVILKPFRLNEVVLFFAGAITPYYFMAAALFLTDRLSWTSFLPHVSLHTPVVKSTVWLAVSILLLAVPFLAGGFFVQSQLHKLLIQVRKAWSILLFYLLLAFFIPFVNSNSSFSNWSLLAVPFACFHAATYYYPVKKWMPNGLLIFTAGYVLYLQYGTPLWR